MSSLSRLLALALISAVMVPPISPAFAQTPAEGALLGVWKITCADGPCRAFLNISHEGEIVVTWTILRDRAGDQSSSLIQVPLGVALPPGLRVYTDDTTFFDVPYQVCDEKGCTAIAVMDAEMQSAIAGQNSVRVTFIRYGQPQTFAYEVPVNGFSQVLEAL